MSQESFFERGEDSMMRKQKTMTVNKRQVALKRKYQESYMFITTGDSYSPSPLFTCDDWFISQSHEIFKTTSPDGDQAPCIKRTSLLSFPKEKKK